MRLLVFLFFGLFSLQGTLARGASFVLPCYQIQSLNSWSKYLKSVNAQILLDGLDPRISDQPTVVPKRFHDKDDVRRLVHLSGKPWTSTFSKSGSTGIQGNPLNPFFAFGPVLSSALGFRLFLNADGNAELHFPRANQLEQTLKRINRTLDASMGILPTRVGTVTPYKRLVYGSQESGEFRALSALNDSDEASFASEVAFRLFGFLFSEREAERARLLNASVVMVNKYFSRVSKSGVSTKMEHEVLQSLVAAREGQYGRGLANTIISLSQMRASKLAQSEYHKAQLMKGQFPYRSARFGFPLVLPELAPSDFENLNQAQASEMAVLHRAFSQSLNSLLIPGVDVRTYLLWSLAEVSGIAIQDFQVGFYQRSLQGIQKLGLSPVPTGFDGTREAIVYSPAERSDFILRVRTFFHANAKFFDGAESDWDKASPEIAAQKFIEDSDSRVELITRAAVAVTTKAQPKR